MAPSSAIDRGVHAAVARAAWLSKRFRDRTRAFGTRRGLPISVRDSLARKSLRRVTRPDADSEVTSRLGRGQSDIATLIQVFADQSFDFRYPEDVRWIVDAGANVGYASLWFAERHPEATVIAIEPDAENYRLLVENTAHLGRVITLNGALMPFDGPGVLVDPGEGAWAFRVQPAETRWGDGRVVGEVDCVSIPTLIARHGIDRIGVLKLDIEGGELDVLGECAAWIDRVDCAVVELHDRIRPGCTRAFANATAEFSVEAHRGENFFVSRHART